MGAKEEQIEAHQNGMRLLTVIKPGELKEVYEILCEIPFEGSMMIDSEPINARHPVIESLINEICLRIQYDEFQE